MSPRKGEPKTRAAVHAKIRRSNVSATTRVSYLSKETVHAFIPGHQAYSAAWNEGYALGLAFRASELWLEGDLHLPFALALRAFRHLRWADRDLADALRDQRKGWGSLRFEVLR